MDAEKFWNICSANNIILDPEQMKMFNSFHDNLKEQNQKVNLISRKDEGNIWSNHILHSLTILKYTDICLKANCLDIGTGGGLPGIPLKIARNDINMTMADSIAKKIKITEELADDTGLKHLTAIRTRVEDISKDNKYDIIVARAVSKLDKILSWSKKLAKRNTKWALLKGGDLSEEIAIAKEKFPKLYITEKLLELKDYNYFADEDKKIILCEYKK